MKLTPELKKRIDGYFEQMTEEDLLKAFPDLLEKDSIYSSEEKAIEAGATGYVACKQGSCYFVIDTSKGYDENTLMYNSPICNVISKERALEIIELYETKDKPCFQAINLDFVENYCKRFSTLFGGEAHKMSIHSFVETYNTFIADEK